MKIELKNILNLSKIFIKENDVNTKIIDWDNKKLNKKSFLFWTYIILIFGILYVSTEIIDFFRKTGKPEIFLNGYFLFLEVIIIMRTIMISTNIFYFSKDIENILFLPLKPIEILISKFTTILFMNYEIELIIGIIPLLMYGNYIYMGPGYFFQLIAILILFPIFTTLIVSIVMMFLMKFLMVFKNKDLMQIVISFILISVITFSLNKGVTYIFNNIDNIESNKVEIANTINEKLIEFNKYFININPSINILLRNKGILNFIKLILLNGLAFLIFLYLGSKFYLKQILKASFYYKNKKTKKVKTGRKHSVGVTYIKKEFKTLIKNPLFFIQSVYPVITTTILMSILIIVLTPQAIEMLKSDELAEVAKDLHFEIESACVILGGIQILGLMNYTSITAFSREGKNAYVIKYLPIDLYKQFIYKNIPQIVINAICSSVIFLVIGLNIPGIEYKYIGLMWIISFILIMLNSYILTLIDLLMPRLEWDAEYEILKNSKNKLLQYVLVVFNVIFLIFVNKLFAKHSLNASFYSLIAILTIIFIIFNIIIYKKKTKLYKNLN